MGKTFSRENYANSRLFESKYCFYFRVILLKKKIWLIIPRKDHTQNCTKCGIFLNTNIKEITFNKAISYFKGHYLIKRLHKSKKIYMNTRLWFLHSPEEAGLEIWSVQVPPVPRAVLGPLLRCRLAEVY